MDHAPVIANIMFQLNIDQDAVRPESVEGQFWVIILTKQLRFLIVYSTRKT